MGNSPISFITIMTHVAAGYAAAQQPARSGRDQRIGAIFVSAIAGLILANRWPRSSTLLINAVLLGAAWWLTGSEPPPSGGGSARRRLSTDFVPPDGRPPGTYVPPSPAGGPLRTYVPPPPSRWQADRPASAPLGSAYPPGSSLFSRPPSPSAVPPPLGHVGVGDSAVRPLATGAWSPPPPEVLPPSGFAGFGAVHRVDTTAWDVPPPSRSVGDGTRDPLATVAGLSPPQGHVRVGGGVSPPVTAANFTLQSRGAPPSVAVPPHLSRAPAQGAHFVAPAADAAVSDAGRPWQPGAGRGRFSAAGGHPRDALPPPPSSDDDPSSLPLPQGPQATRVRAPSPPPAELLGTGHERAPNPPAGDARRRRDPSPPAGDARRRREPSPPPGAADTRAPR